jgi:hypothetical protein
MTLLSRLMRCNTLEITVSGKDCYRQSKILFFIGHRWLHLCECLSTAYSGRPEEAICDFPYPLALVGADGERAAGSAQKMYAHNR